MTQEIGMESAAFFCQTLIRVCVGGKKKIKNPIPKTWAVGPGVVVLEGIWRHAKPRDKTAFDVMLVKQRAPRLEQVQKV